ncbi:hypothetical protein ACFLQW_01975 [Candidatus Zixiibacteriota bacterium]
MAKKTNFLIGALIAVTLVLCSTANVYGIWAVEFESKTVYQNETDISVAMRVYWDLDMSGLIVPVVIRSTSGSAFWSLPLPVDTAGGTAVGVTWNWSNPGWAILVEEVKVGIPFGSCDDEGDVGYDAISPDHFCIAAGGVGGTTPAEPSGRDVLYLTIDANGNDGEFEFDTACFSSSLNVIYMADELAQEHGPGTGDFDHFTPGIITISGPPPEYEIPWMSINGGGDDESSAGYQVMYSVAQSAAGHGTSAAYEVGIGYWYGADYGGGGGECDCGATGDVNGDTSTDPLDVSYLVNKVYLGQDALHDYTATCTYPNGDVNCDASTDPLDVSYLVNKVYLGQDALCERCP